MTARQVVSCNRCGAAVDQRRTLVANLYEVRVTEPTRKRSARDAHGARTAAEGSRAGGLRVLKAELGIDLCGVCARSFLLFLAGDAVHLSAVVRL